MYKNRIGKPHVVRLANPGKDIISCQETLHNYVKVNVFKFLKGKKCNFSEDLIGDTFVEIAEYTKKFSKDRKVSPQTFINLRLKGSIVDNYLKHLQSVRTPRSASKYDRETGIKDQSDFFSNVFDNSINPIDIHSDKDHIEKEVDSDFQNLSPDKNIQRSEINRLKNNIINFVNSEMKKDERDIFNMRFIDGLTQKEVARKLGKKHQSISWREKSILSKINKKFPQKIQDLDI